MIKKINFTYYGTSFLLVKHLSIIVLLLLLANCDTGRLANQTSPMTFRSEKELKTNKPGDADNQPEIENKQPKSFIFIRHGSTDFNWRHIHKGPQDLGLNKAGKKHVTSLAMKLVELDNIPVTIITSTLKRCVETASLVKKETLRLTFAKDFLERMNLCMLGMDIPISEDKTLSEVYRGKSLQVNSIPIIKDMRLQEIDRGDWSKDQDLQTKAKEIVEEYEKKINLRQIDESKARREVLQKLPELGLPSDAEKWEDFVERAKLLDKILAQEPNGTFVVSHGMVIKEYLKYKLGKTIFVQEIEPKWIGEDRPAIKADYNTNDKSLVAEVLD